MKIAYILLAAAAVVETPAWGNQELAKKNACLACLAVDKKMAGPAYQDIGKKYGIQKDAEAMLAKSIKAGGSDRWSPVPMPPQPGITEVEAMTLATWILNGAKWRPVNSPRNHST